MLDSHGVGFRRRRDSGVNFAIHGSDSRKPSDVVKGCRNGSVNENHYKKPNSITSYNKQTTLFVF